MAVPAWGFDQGRRLPGGFVKTVLAIIYAILLLHFEVARVRARDGILGQTFDMLVYVQIDGIVISPFIWFD